jgi:predicted ATPase
MQLKHLYIKDYKILKDFTIEFPHDNKKYISVFIGANGSGKSTIIEAIAQIFSSVFLKKKSLFGFKLEYQIKKSQIDNFNLKNISKNFDISISSKDKNEEIILNVSNKGKLISTFEIYNKTHSFYLNGAEIFTSLIFLPDNIVIYYSGLSKILKNLCQPHDDLLSEYYRQDIINIKRNFFYFQPEHFGIILLSLLTFEYGDIPIFLREKAKIAEVQSVQIRLQKPDWAKGSVEEFWGARGEVRKFLNYLDENSATFEELKNPTKLSRPGIIVIEALQNEEILITIVSKEKLYEIREYFIEERKLFELFNIMLGDGLLKDISFSFTKENNSKQESFNILSEGEQQAIVIKGLTEFLAEKNSLFLFDEPDTYLHPKWQRQFITGIEKTIHQSDNSESSYVIATHSPQLLSNAKTEMNFVKIIEDGLLIKNTPKHYGREIGTILYDLMDVEERNEIIRKQISDLYTLIEEEDVEEAEKLLADLQNIIGEDDTELKRAEIQIEYLKEEE